MNATNNSWYPEHMSVDPLNDVNHGKEETYKLDKEPEIRKDKINLTTIPKDH